MSAFTAATTLCVPLQFFCSSVEYPHPHVPIVLPFKNCRLVAQNTSPSRASNLDVVAKESRVAQVKNGFAPKICATCAKPFEWRKKWARDWQNVRFCSDRCRRSS
ncbi:MAG: DUF2256 domain-containing protein [Acidimicrobiia bacterium]|nr:DUF2256 domain-containing protein [Acidimicrobiia bacterium]NDD72175.1 DUF2256 domain-containing protein [Actinomycetota bacterium]